MIRLAIAGTGTIAKTHARATASLGNCELVASVNYRAASLAEFASSYGIERQYQSLDQLIADGDIDALIVCTPNALHAPQTLTALENGIHVLVEKPMALNASEARVMLERSESCDSILQVAHCLRFLPDVTALRDKLSKGVIGHIIRTRSVAAHNNWGPSGWFINSELAGGGALIDMGIHAIDTLRYTLGDPMPVSVYANIGTYYGEYAVDDCGFASIRWSNGATSIVEFGWWYPYGAGVVATTEYLASEGYARLLPSEIRRCDPTNREAVTVETMSSDIDDLDRLFEQMYREQLAAFLNNIENNVAPSPGAREGLINMQIVDAAYQSSRSDQVVRITEES